MNKEIQQIENKIKQIQEKINARKQQISTYESTLLALIEEINNLKTNYEKNK